MKSLSVFAILSLISLMVSAQEPPSSPSIFLAELIIERTDATIIKQVKDKSTWMIITHLPSNYTLDLVKNDTKYIVNQYSDVKTLASWEYFEERKQYSKILGIENYTLLIVYKIEKNELCYFCSF